MERDVCEVRRVTNSDRLRREKTGRINRGEQVGEIDPTDSEILGVHVCPPRHIQYVVNGTDHTETFMDSECFHGWLTFKFSAVRQSLVLLSYGEGLPLFIV